MSRMDLYLETASRYTSARVELWPDEGLPEIHVFAFDDINQFIIFENWLNATIDLIKGRNSANDRVFRRTARDS